MSKRTVEAGRKLSRRIILRVPPRARRPRLIVIGGGEHARVVIETARCGDYNWAVLGFVDVRSVPETSERMDVRQLADDDEALQYVANAWFVIAIGGIGSLELRRKIARRYSSAGARWARLIHPTAWVSPTATVKDGATICAGAVVNAGAMLGAHSIVNTAAVVEHDVLVGDFASIAPGAVIGGGTEIGEGSYLGLGCRVRDHLRIGRGSIVGMGAVVVRDVLASVQVIGVPARVFQKGRDV